MSPRLDHRAEECWNAARFLGDVVLTDNAAPLIPAYVRDTVENPSLHPRRTVLIVDQSAETREVLRTALEGERTHVLETHRADRGLEMLRRHRPNLVVLDLELDGAAADSLAADFNAETEASETPVLMLGGARRMRHVRPGWQFMDKPYHYAPLIRKIEALLEGAAEPPLRRCA